MVEKEEGGDCNHFDALNNIIVFRSDGNESTRWVQSNSQERHEAMRCSFRYVAELRLL
jgi:hypothetical protein